MQEPSPVAPAMTPRDAFQIVERMTAEAKGTRQDHMLTVQALNLLQGLVLEKEMGDKRDLLGTPASSNGHVEAVES